VIYYFSFDVQEDAAEFAPEDRGLANIFMLASRDGNQSILDVYGISWLKLDHITSLIPRQKQIRINGI
jgi:aminopeptidase-like protein